MRKQRETRTLRYKREIARNLAELGRRDEQPSLKREEPRGGIPARRGYAEANGQPGTDQPTGGGIASPLIEGAVPPEPPENDPDKVMTAVPKLARAYWPDGLWSSDGLFMLPALKTITLRDANGARVIVQLAEPKKPGEAEPTT